MGEEYVKERKYFLSLFVDKYSKESKENIYYPLFTPILIKQNQEYFTAFTFNKCCLNRIKEIIESSYEESDPKTFLINQLSTFFLQPVWIKNNDATYSKFTCIYKLMKDLFSLSFHFDQLDNPVTWGPQFVEFQGQMDILNLFIPIWSYLYLLVCYQHFIDLHPSPPLGPSISQLRLYLETEIQKVYNLLNEKDDSRNSDEENHKRKKIFLNMLSTFDIKSKIYLFRQKFKEVGLFRQMTFSSSDKKLCVYLLVDNFLFLMGAKSIAFYTLKFISLIYQNRDSIAYFLSFFDYQYIKNFVKECSQNLSISNILTQIQQYFFSTTKKTIVNVQMVNDVANLAVCDVQTLVNSGSSYANAVKQCQSTITTTKSTTTLTNNNFPTLIPSFSASNYVTIAVDYLMLVGPFIYAIHKFYNKYIQYKYQNISSLPVLNIKQTPSTTVYNQNIQVVD